jgi:hypothetical protein
MGDRQMVRRGIRMRNPRLKGLKGLITQRETSMQLREIAGVKE